MSILIDKNTRVMRQGITGNQASFYVERAISFGTEMVAGVRPGKGGIKYLGLPVFNTVAEARAESGANASVIFVPKSTAADAIIESIEAEKELIVCITEHIPVLDMVRVAHVLKDSKSRLIGPNTPGIITPGECRIGIMPGEIFRKGSVGIVSRSSTLTYEAIDQTSAEGLGQSTVIGVGGDPVHGMGFVECLKLFDDDDKTLAVVLIGEIGGFEEQKAAEYLQSVRYGKPVIAYIVGQYAPDNTRMGHASAIIKNESGTAEEKMKALKDAGVFVVDSPLLLGEQVRQTLESKS